MDNQKNLLLAVVFSLVILIGFDFFFAPKKSEINKVQVNENISEESLDKNTPFIDSSLVKKSNEIKSSEKRIKFKANRIEGSINLFGATIDEIIYRWAPPSENSTDKYVEFVCKKLDKEKDVRLNNSMEDYLPLVKAIIQMENGMQPYDDELLVEGMYKAWEGLPTASTAE